MSPIPATILRDDGFMGDDDRPERQPGQFARSRTGAPWVHDPVRTTKHTGTKADLIALCANAGLTIPEGKVTVAMLQGLLGERPCKVQYGRPSGLGKQIENTTNLQKWAERGVALGIFRDRGLLRGLDWDRLDEPTLDDDEARIELDKVAAAAKRRAGCDLAADRGTFVHKLLEVFDRG